MRFVSKSSFNERGIVKGLNNAADIFQTHTHCYVSKYSRTVLKCFNVSEKECAKI